MKFHKTSEVEKTDTYTRFPQQLKSFTLAEPSCSAKMHEVFKANWSRLPDYQQLTSKVMKSLVDEVSNEKLPSNLTMKHHPKIGWGAFVAENKTIKAKKIIGIYTGKVMLVNPIDPKKNALSGHEDYNFRIHTDRIYVKRAQFEALCKEGSARCDAGYDIAKGLEFIVDASKSGNFTRFINHSDTPNLIARCKLVESKKGFQIVIVFIAKRALKSNEPLSFNYGPGYWANKGIEPQELSAAEFT